MFIDNRSNRRIGCCAKHLAMHAVMPNGDNAKTIGSRRASYLLHLEKFLSLIVCVTLRNVNSSQGCQILNVQSFALGSEASFSGREQVMNVWRMT